MRYVAGQERLVEAGRVTDHLSLTPVPNVWQQAVVDRVLPYVRD